MIDHAPRSRVVFEEPYQFVPPHPSRLWPRLLRPAASLYRRYGFGVVEVECRGVSRLAASVASGRGILLAPNHCRDCDPHVLAALAAESGRAFFTMASAHLFMQGRLKAWLLRRAGAFSVYREGIDRAALSAATEILVEGERPLVVFPEGVISRTNEHLNALMTGPALIARTAARRRAKAGAPGVAVHPVAIRYVLLDDPEELLAPRLEALERRLGRPAQGGLPLAERVVTLGEGLLAAKERELLGRVQEGTPRERTLRLIERLLAPFEAEWTGGRSDSDPIARIKRLRAAILPGLVKGGLPERERQRRRRQLADLDLVQQLDHYPQDYVRSRPTPERLLETVERFEEDLAGRVSVQPRLKAIVEVGEAIPAAPDGDDRALMDAVDAGLRGMLGLATR